jgi:4-amino-4-deoxy-L-arabinose transferase-like glycosyltransferase
MILVAILALGGLLRLINLDAVEHNVDHAYPIWQALTTLDRGVLPITAQGTSVLFDNPALTGYLFVPFVALTRSPVGAYLFVIALNTLAILLVYDAAVQLTDRRRALIAALLMAINPWVVEYSRTTWVQSLMPFFACLVFWLIVPVLLGTAQRPARRTIWAFVALAAMTQTYLLAYAILLPFGVLLILFRDRVPWRAVIVGAGIFALVTGIYAAGLIAKSETTLARAQAFASGESQLSAEAFNHALRLVSGYNYPAARGTEAPIRDWELREGLTTAAHLLITILIGINAILSIYAILFRRERNVLIALVWFAAPILMMSYVSRPVHPFYLLLTLPAGTILAAGVIPLELRAVRYAVIAVCAPLVILNALNVFRYAEETRALPGVHGFTAMPLGESMSMTRELMPENTVVFADVDEWILNSLRGQLFPVNRQIQPDVLINPKDGAVYLNLRVDSPEFLITPDERTTYEFADGTTVYADSFDVPTLPTNTTANPITSGEGITFLGSEIGTIEGGAEVEIRTYWRVDALHPDRAGWLFSPFVHIYDSADRRVGIGGGVVVPGAAWQQGDIHIQRVRVSVASDSTSPYTVLVGQYDGVHNLNVIFTLPDGSTSATIRASVQTE